MPRGDGTGPRGMGPMTGRAAGFCAGYDVPGFGNPALGRGFGMGGGRGWRNRFYATGIPGRMLYHRYYPPIAQTDPEMEKQLLKNQADALESELDFVKKRLSEIDTGTDTKAK
jgi:hypothetical protein